MRPEALERKHRQLLFREIGAYLGRKRMEAGLKQAEIGRISGYSAQFVSNIECGAAFPPTRLMTKMIEAYGIPKEEFLSTLMRLQMKYYRNLYFENASRSRGSRARASG